jgi:diadenylate cyclase
MTDGLRKRVEISQQMRSLLISARRIAVENDAQALVILAEVPFDFAAIKQY